MPAKKKPGRGRPAGPVKVFFATKILEATDREIRRLAKGQPSIGSVLDAAFGKEPPGHFAEACGHFVESDIQELLA